MYTATEDCITVLTVESCLRQSKTSTVMFLLTLVQSRCHVDTVNNALHSITNWSNICWSHTMKALGLHVTFVKRNSASVVILRYTYADIKVWSRMFAVTVQNVSVQQVNWKVISWYTQMSKYLGVVYVLKLSSVNKVFWSTSRNVPVSWVSLLF